MDAFTRNERVHQPPPPMARRTIPSIPVLALARGKAAAAAAAAAAGTSHQGPSGDTQGGYAYEHSDAPFQPRPVAHHQLHHQHQHQRPLMPPPLWTEPPQHSWSHQAERNGGGGGTGPSGNGYGWPDQHSDYYRMPLQTLGQPGAQQQQQQQLPPPPPPQQQHALYAADPAVPTYYQQAPPPPLEQVPAAADNCAHYDAGNEDPTANTPPFQYHDSSADCTCPSCLQAKHITFLYSNQRRASLHVMAAQPSPNFSEPGRQPPPLQSVAPSHLRRCPVYDAYRFCPYSTACYLPHIDPLGNDDGGNAAIEDLRMLLVRRAATVEAEVERLIAKAAEHRDNDYWNCDVCGNTGIDEFTVSAVGASYWYRFCPRCTYHCYCPYITYLVEHLIESVGDDYQQYMTQIQHYRALLPEEFKIPLSLEAHRVASVVFAWSLVSPAHLRDAVETAHASLPGMTAIISMGSGAGYVEHILNRIMHPGVPATQPGSATQRRVKASKFSTSSFDGVRVSFYGKKRVPIFAFDEIAMRLTYSVHVSLGGPLSILSMRCDTTVLMLCWPPFGCPEEEQSSMAFETLEYFTRSGGSVVIYVGDVAATGDWRFHKLLFTSYRLVRNYTVRREVRRWHPAEMGYVYAGNDTIGVYERRAVPL